jgi:monoamine oxidase
MYDVLIIGAGISGLAAADKLSKTQSILILEARNRCGGRIFTKHSKNSSTFIDLGAEFLHGEAKETYKIADLEKLPVYEVSDAHHVLENGKLKPLKDFWEEFIEFIDSYKLSSKDISYAEMVRDATNSEVEFLASSFVEGFDAAERSKVSAKSVIEMKSNMKSGEAMKMTRLTNGYDGIIKHFTKNKSVSEKIRLKHIVTEVKWKKHFAEVTAATPIGKRTFRAKKVLITIPLGVLKAPEGLPGSVKFDPPIPKLQENLQKLEMGHVIKVLLYFEEEFYKHLKDRNFIHLRSQPFQVMWTQSPLLVPVITMWAGGTAAVNLAFYSRKEKYALALACLEKALCVEKKEIMKFLKGAYLHDWSKDPFSRGAYSYIGVGGIDIPQEMAKPIQNTIYFAGEAFSTGEPGTVEGALSSGLAAAERML